MLRRFVFGIGVLVLAAGGLLADDFFAAKVKKVDDKTLTVTVDDKDKEPLTIAKDAKIFKVEGKGKKATNKNIDGGIKGLKEGTPVTVWTETRDNKEVVTQVRVDNPTPRKKK